MLRILALAVLVLVCQAADGGAEPKLPAAAQSAIDRLDRAMVKLEADHRKAVSAERQKAMAELEKAQKTATRAGDLDGALAIRTRLEDLQKAEAADADALLGDRAPAKADLAKQVLGTWAIIKTGGAGGGATCDINDGGNVVAHLGQLMVPGRWRVEKGRLVINWLGDEARWENLGPESADRMAGDSFDAGKNGISLTRIKGPGPAAPPR